ncbi:MAG: LysR family transcriptional regulator [Pseudomonadota bacterium]
MDLWSEMRTAMVLARFGTVRAAADELGLHRATVTRHIDLLEERLQTKLFLRHSNGYTPTRDGLALRAVAEGADDLIAQFVNRTRNDGDELAGELVLSALGRTFLLFAPAIRSFTELHPNVSIRLNAEYRIVNLETGEADIAIRVGPKPSEPDYVALPFHQFAIGLAGHKSYFETNAIPSNVKELEDHRFVAIQFPSGHFDVVELYGAPRSNISIVCNDPTAAYDSISVGAGLGLMEQSDIENDPDLREVLPKSPPIVVPVWLVTHMDAHRTNLIQAFIRHVKDFAKQLPAQHEFPKKSPYLPQE